MARLRSRVLAVTIVSACGFSVSLTGESDKDAAVPDAGPCRDLGVTCAGDELRRCITKDQLPTIEPCEWGCLDGPPAHCGEVVPGGALLPTDLVDNPQLAPTVTVSGDNFDTDDGSIRSDSSLRSSGTGYQDGIEYFTRGNVGVFRFRNVTLNGTIDVRGTRALAIVAIGTITVNGAIDVRGDCSGSNAGPGGTRGGSGGSAAPGAGGGKGGTGGSGNCSGGAGGSYGSLGGSGGSSNAQSTRPPPGTTTTNIEVAMLVGGAGGGGGGGSSDDRGDGGGGGGAIQLFATGGIVFTNGTINASGCGGGRGASNSCGGGGGAGGAILLEGKTISFGSGAKLVINGGGGGGGDGSSGSNGQLSLSRANGGASGGGQTGAGGSGGASVGLPGLPGESVISTPGGGGGGVGWMRFNTRSGSAMVTTGALCSPQFGDPATTTSQGKVRVQ